MFDSPRDFPRNLTTCKEIEMQPLEIRRTKTGHTSEDGQNYGTIPMPTFATRPWTSSSKHPVELLQNYMVAEQRQQMWELQFDRFSNPSSFLVKTRFKTEVSSGSDFPSEAVFLIKEVEMVDSLDEKKSSRSVYGKGFSKL